MASENLVCSACQSTGAGLRCSGCQSVYYCNADCQKKNWTALHKVLCPALKAISAGSAYVKVVIQEGSGPTPPRGSSCTMHYEGKLLNGKIFDSSRPKGRTFRFRVGQGEVITAWDEGVAQMKKGERAYLVASSKYAYGSHGAGDVIPPHATLVFDVELIDFQ